MTDAVVSVCPSKTGPLDEVEREFGEPVVVPLPSGAEAAPGCGPNPQLDLFFADMTGDGLPDLVRVRRGTVEYWPSLGNGRFGERVVMAGAPTIPTATGFDSARVRLVDLDGSGTADVLYLDDGRLWHFPNLGGRQLGARREIGALPAFDGRSAAIADLAGDGRPSLLWSATSPTRGHALSYLPLVPPTPPGMLIAIDDGCGRRTELAWGNSATHYLRDAADGVPWETRLPSHRPVIDARVELDLIGGTSVTTRYRYRDGYFDGAGGAFRGFGRVETLDVPQALPRLGGGLGDGGVPAGASDEPAFAPPLLTRTWFHLGTAMWNHHRPFDPYDGDPLLPPIGPHVEAPGSHLPADAAAALRLLAGSVVRRERWAVDAAEAPVAHPFDVEQASYQLVLSQPRRGAQRPVFGVVPRVRRLATYEGQGGDPRVTEELVLAHDAWGAPTRTAQVAYARRGAVDDAAQARTWVTVTDSGRADVDVDGQFLLGVELEASQRELVGVSPVGGRLGVEALTAPAVVAALASPASFEQALDPAVPAPAARRLSWQRTYYWDAARAAEAPFGVVPKAPRVHHAEVACLTPGLVAATLAPRIDAAGLAALGYVLADGHWWQRGPVQEVGGAFGLVTRTVRGDGATAEQVYDDDQLVVTAQIDALELSTTSLIDYRVMAPAQTTDPNGTTRSALHDGFGRVVASGVEGHVGAQPWMSGTAIGWAAGAATVASVLADPAGYLADAATATLIDDRAWARDATPVAEVTVARRALVDDGAGGGAASGPLEVRVRYLDGFGRVLQEKVRVEAGPAIQRDVGGAVIVDAGGRPVLAPASERWQVSGHVVYDAKGQPGRVYEPYFSPSAAYESDAVLARFGVSTVTTYDAVGRPVRVDLPNGTYATTAHGAWATTAATPGDTVLDSTYRVVREGRPVDDAERVAYEHAAGHAGTPTETYVDARGVACATRAVGDASATDAWTRQVLDATGQARAVVDARGNLAFTYVRDLRGRVVAQTSVDAGPTWALADAYDRPVWTWDGRGFAVTRGFDVADRPTTVHVTGGDGATAMDAMVETYRYGDQAVDYAAAVAANTVGRLVEVKDGAGVVTVSAYDPLGAVRAQGRRLRATVDEAPDWRGAEAVESEVLTTSTRTDALGREVWTALADGTTRETVYARGGALVEVRVTTPDGALVEAPIVADVARDAHGRVVAATLGNGVGQTWAYDPASGRLVAQDAVRGTRAYQGLRCTYDPDGKLVRMLDVAQDGPGALVPGAVSARRDFGYDAHGRLVEATGRVHQALLPHDGPTTAGCVHGARHLSLNNGAALERYTQRFTYDAGGNLTRVQHAGTTASWATDYWVAAGSNRSTAAEDGNGVPVLNPAGMFDAGGNLRELWHLRALGWSWRGCLTHATTVARASGPVDDGERYAYGADRVRVRKVATRLVVGGAEPVVETREVVYCGGGHERVRVARNGTLVLERWTTHVSDGDRRVAVIDRHVIDTLANEVDAIGPARVRYHLTTPQGSTEVELDEAGQLISYEEYLPHGGSAFIAGDDVREVARRDVRYAGKERDRATGLDAYPQRYYAPWLGRWLSPDPIGPKDGLNLYALVGGDPVGYVDPEGTDRHATERPPVDDEFGGFEGKPPVGGDGSYFFAYDRDGNLLDTYVYSAAVGWEPLSKSRNAIRLDDTAPAPGSPVEDRSRGWAYDPTDYSFGAESGPQRIGFVGATRNVVGVTADQADELEPRIDASQPQLSEDAQMMARQHLRMHAEVDDIEAVGLSSTDAEIKKQGDLARHHAIEEVEAAKRELRAARSARRWGRVAVVALAVVTVLTAGAAAPATTSIAGGVTAATTIATGVATGTVAAATEVMEGTGAIDSRTAAEIDSANAQAQALGTVPSLAAGVGGSAVAGERGMIVSANVANAAQFAYGGWRAWQWINRPSLPPGGLWGPDGPPAPVGGPVPQTSMPTGAEESSLAARPMGPTTSPPVDVAESPVVEAGATAFSSGGQNATIRTIGKPDAWTDPQALDAVTGKAAQARNRALRAIEAEDFPDLKLTHRGTQRYSPYVRFGVARTGVGEEAVAASSPTQVGWASFETRAQLRDTVVHEELHYRWARRGLPVDTHHPMGSESESRFYLTIDRYFRLRGWRR